MVSTNEIKIIVQDDAVLSGSIFQGGIFQGGSDFEIVDDCSDDDIEIINADELSETQKEEQKERERCLRRENSLDLHSAIAGASNDTKKTLDSDSETECRDTNSSALEPKC